MTSYVNRSGGVGARNGTSTHTITFATDGDAPFTPTDGNLLVFVVGGGVTDSFPGGWTKQLSAVNNTELAVATATASSTTAVTITHNGSNYPIAWQVFEFPAGSTYVSGATATNTSRTAAQPTVSGLDGSAHTVLYAADWQRATGESGLSATWSVTEDYDTEVVFSTTDGIWMTVAHEDGNTSASVTATPTISGAATAGVERVTAVVTAASGSSPTAPTVNAGIDATVTTGNVFNRTATENGNGATITARAWTVVSGPAQVGNTLSTAAALSWTPGTAGTYVLRYSATNSAGTGTDDATITVNDPVISVYGPPTSQAPWIGFFAAT